MGLQGSFAADGVSFAVDSTRDAVDARLGDGVCATAAADCTLRAAIQEANALAGLQEIVLPAGTYALTLRPQNDNLADTGDHDVTAPLTIVGQGADATIIDAGPPPAGAPPLVGGLDRVLELHPTAGDVSISGLSIRDGYTSESGGGIQSATTGTLRLEDVSVFGSYAGKYGGGINNSASGRVELVGSTVSGNGANEGGSGINNAAGGTVAILADSAVVDNPGAYPVSGGAVHNQGEGDAIGTIDVRDSAISGNSSYRDGAGIHNARDGRVLIQDATLTLNVSLSEGGAVYTSSGSVVVSESTISENEAVYGGGLFNGGAISKAGERGRIELSGATVSRNTATSSGGGIHNQLEGELALVDTTVSDNAAGSEGGGIANLHKASLSVSGGRVTGNSAGASGGGVHTLAEESVSFDAVVFSGNSAGEDGGGVNLGGLAPISIAASTFTGNRAGLDGGAIAISAKGDVTIDRSDLRDNVAAGNGGGIQNSGSLVTLTQLTVEGNTATGNGGGIDNTSSGDFVVVDSTIDANAGENGGGFANSPDSTLLMSRSTLSANRATGSGGGFYSVSDGDSRIENTTVSGNSAEVSGGGVFHDADGQLDLVHLTVWQNAAPLGGGISTTETDTVPSFPPVPNPSIVVRNSIVGGSLRGGSCDAMLTSSGGNLDSGTSCLLNGPRDRSRVDPGLEALADNGGLTGTHALVAGSLAIDGGLDPCPDTDQRGVIRPQHHGCDTGAYEFVDAPPAPDDVPPDTSITNASRAPNGMPVFAFVGTDDVSSAAQLLFECRILRLAPGQQPPSDAEPFSPCSSPHAVAELEHGENTFEVRAVDRAGNVDPTPPRAPFVDAADTTAPETALEAAPSDPSLAEEAIFGFTGTDDLTPLVLLAFECRVDADELTPFVPCRSPQSYTGNPLAVGLHRFEVRAVDLAGNVDPTPVTFDWTVMAPPNTIIDSGPEDSDSGDVEFSFSSDQLPATFECALDGAPFQPCTSPHVLVDVAVGDHELAVRATNVHGLTDESPATHPWKVGPDVTPPETVIEATPPAAGESTSAEFTFSANQRRSTFACSLDGEVFSGCTSPQTYTGLAVGAHTIAVRATDPAGNTDTSPASHAWTVVTDTTAPETEIRSGPTVVSGSPAASFELAASDPGRPESVLAFECSVDGAAFEACVSPKEYSRLADGEHVFAVRAVDEAGNLDASPASFGWRVDAVAPETSIGSAPAAVTSSTSGAIVFSADEAASFECSLDGAAFAACGSPLAYGDLTDGDHRFEVRAVDEAGNVDASPARVAWRVDTVAPETVIVAAPADPSASAVALFAFAANESASFECSLDGAAFVACSSPQVPAALADGSHEFEVRAVDEAGNVDTSPASFGWRVDTTAPETTIDSGPPASTTSTAALFTFSASELGSSFECSLDGGVFAACQSPQPYSGLPLGAHRFEVRATDTAGNTDTTPAVHAWSVVAPPDTTAPETTIDSGPPASTTSTAALFTFSASELGSSFECSLDGGVFAACQSPQPYSGLPLGAHRFEVRATDTAGNTDTTPAVHAWSVVAPPDTTAPETTIDSGPPASTTSTAALFTFSASELGSSFECSLDGGVFAACQSPQPYSGLPLGAHRFEVRATDTAGNTDTTPAVHAWSVVAPPDTTAPETTIDSGPPASTTSTAALFTFSASELGSSFECSLDGGVFAACQSPQPYSGLPLGAHRFEVRATDTAGNTDTTPAVHAWSVVAPPDTTAPETTIDSGPPASTTSTAALFTFSASELGSSFECSLDGGVFAACQSPQPYSGLPLGAHRFEVRATDTAGNTDTSAAFHAWRIEPAPPVSCPSITLVASADSWLDENSASNNFGSDSILKLRSKGPRDNFRALVRFALPATIPAGCRVGSASLRLLAASASSGRTLHALRVTAGWSESLVTWTTQPGTAGAPAATASGAGTRVWEVTSQVQAMYDSAALHGFLIRDAAENGDAEQSFHSREKGESPPVLTVVFAPAGG